MDVEPENINPEIVRIARVNPMIRAIFSMYLQGIEVVQGQDGTMLPLTWRQALEMMVLKLSEQYGGALEGWKDQSKKAKPKKDTQLALVDEKKAEPEFLVETGEDWKLRAEKAEETLHIAKGMLSKFVSPARRKWAEKGGDHEDFPPLILTNSMVQQIVALIGEENLEKYFKAQACDRCGFSAWFIQGEAQRCAVCDARAKVATSDIRRQMAERKLSKYEAASACPTLPSSE